MPIEFEGNSPYAKCRIDPEFVAKEVAFFAAGDQRAKGRDIIVLTDVAGVAERLSDKRVIDYPIGRPEFIDLDILGRLVVLAIDNDEVGAQAVRDVLDKEGRFFPVRRGGLVAGYYHNNLAWRRAAHAEFQRQTAENFVKWSQLDFDNLVQALDRTEHLEGDYVEVGCYRGSSGSAVLSYLESTGKRRKCWFFDVFEGFNYDAAINSADAVWEGTHKGDGQAAVAKRLKRFSSDRLQVEVERLNIIEEPLPSRIKSIAVCNIDVDIYEGVLVGLNKCAPLIVKGGIMFAEDAGHTPHLIGAKRAVDEFMKTDIAAKFVPFYLHSGQMAFFRTL